MGELGYGDGGENTVLNYGPDPDNKYISYYFRTNFEVTDTSNVSDYTINLMRDDGVVIYLNGSEILRINMPEGDIGYDTYTLDYVGGEDENTYFQYLVEKLPLKPGLNTIAVEVHQSGPGSSDISFDLELTANYYTTGDLSYNYESHLVFEPTGGISIKPVFKTTDELPVLIINEFMASNQTAYQDEYGQYEDWIEIYNAGQQVVNIGGLYFTDNLSDPYKWRIPDVYPEQTTIHPGEYMVLFADQDTEQGPLHLNFRLSADGEEIGISTIFQDQFTWIDSVIFGLQTADLSYGRFHDGASAWYIMAQYTPGETNLFTSIPEYEALKFQMQAYPNPANDLLYIHIKNISRYSAEASFDLQLFDLTGRLILRQELFNPGPDFTYTLDLSMVPSGFYLLKAGNGNHEAIERLIIQ